MKTKKYITVIFIVVFSFFFQGCYTQLKQSDIEELDSALLSEYPHNSISKEIVGIWIRGTYWSNYGYRYRSLEFSKNGRVIYIPSSGGSEDETYYGTYTALQVTLFIKFDGIKNSEWVQYRVNADTLSFFNSKESGSSDNILFNVSYSDTSKWVKVR